MRLAAAGALALLLRAENWPQFRGPRGDGTSNEFIGAQWRQAWKVPLPGPGHSSPIVWGDRVFVTAFEKEASVARRLLGREGRLWVVCLDLATGTEVWRRQAPVDDVGKVSGGNQPASPTPATDGAVVVSYFGSFGLIAHRFDGAEAWRLPIGPHAHHMGVGSSPRIHGSLVLLNSETDGECRLYAIDKSTGRVRWSVPRRVRQAGYSSPVVVGDLVAVAGHGGIAAYRLADGSQAWSAQRLGDYLGDYVVATPVVAGALLVHPELAVDPAGRVAWSSPSGGGFPVASAVVSEGRAYTLGRNCVLSCVDVATGRRLGQRRIMDGRCFASPVLSGGLIHAVGMEGRSVSIRARPELDEAGSRELGGQAVGSPAVSGGMLLVRVGASLVAYRGQ